MAPSWLAELVAAEMKRVPPLRPEQVAAIRAVVNSPEAGKTVMAGAAEHDAQKAS